MASECYDKLTQLVPNHTDYKLYHAQALYNAFMFPEAMAVMSTIDDPNMESQVIKLDSAMVCKSFKTCYFCNFFPTFNF